MPRAHGLLDPGAFLRGDTQAHEGAITIDVLDGNWDTVCVFRHCQPSFISGLHAPLYAGISAMEIQAACALLHIAPDADLVAGIQIMSEETARVYSDKA